MQIDPRSDVMVATASAGDRSGAFCPDHRKASSNRLPQIVSADRRLKPNSMSDTNRNSALASVVLPHLAGGYALARWLTGSVIDAEEVVQEACLRAFGKIEKFSRGDARTWVLTIVRQTAYDWLRKNRPADLVRVDDLEAIELTEPTPCEPDCGTQEIIAKADAEMLEAAMGALPAQFRETLVLRDLQGLAYREIAQVTETSIGTVMSRLARARRRLIATLARQAAEGIGARAACPTSPTPELSS